MNRKKAILIISGIIVFFALVGVGVTLVNKSNAPVDTTTNGTSTGISFKDFLPFGNNDDTDTSTGDTNNDNNDTTTPTEIPSTPVSNLKQISNRQVAGITAVDASITIPSMGDSPAQIALVPAVRYIERSTGNVFEQPLNNGSEQRISSTQIPEVYEGSFADHGQSVIFRYLKDDNKTIETFTGKLPNPDIDGEGTDIKGSYLPQDITSISTSPDTSKVFYITNFGAGAIGTASLINGDKKLDIWKSPFTEWLTQWPNIKTITVTTKPSSGIAGFMYSIDSVKGTYNKVLGNVPGLTTLTSPDEKYVLYSSSNAASLSLNLLNRTSKEIVNLSNSTLPEKCVWSADSGTFYCAVPDVLPEAQYPDAWYQGLVSFNDNIVKFTIDGGSTIVGSLGTLSGQAMDAVSLTLDSSEQNLLFINKKDSTLWSLSLTPAQ